MEVGRERGLVKGRARLMATSVRGVSAWASEPVGAQGPSLVLALLLAQERAVGLAQPLELGPWQAPVEAEQAQVPANPWSTVAIAWWLPTV